MTATATVLNELKQLISVRREDVVRAKQYVMKETGTGTQGLADRWLTQQQATSPSVLMLHSEDFQQTLENLARSIRLRMALYQAVWELISTGALVSVGKCESWTPQVGYDTKDGRYSTSMQSRLPLDSITFPYVTDIFRLPSVESFPADTDIFLQGIDCSTLHQGIHDAIEQALLCFRHGLYMPATAMLAAAAEATWTECGTKVAAKLTNPKLEAVMEDAYASISKKVSETRKALESLEGKTLLKSAGRTINDVGNVEVWTTALRERRNALHWDKLKSFIVDHSTAANLLISAPQHLATLEAIRTVC